VTEPFEAEGGRILVRLSPAERGMLRAIPVLLSGAEPDDGDPAWARLQTVGHLEDSARAARFAELTGPMLEEARAADRELLEAGVDATSLDIAEAEAWMRVIGEARLLLGARLGIEEDGWEAEPGDDDPVELNVLRLLGYFQEMLVEALSAGL
jgi:hypothetical protein